MIFLARVGVIVFHFLFVSVGVRIIKLALDEYFLVLKRYHVQGFAFRAFLFLAEHSFHADNVGEMIRAFGASPDILINIIRHNGK
jgi:hypothetical protein